MRLELFLIGAAIGAVVRFVIVEYFKTNYRFPIGVLVANISGAFILGLISKSSTDSAFGLAGFCGALTTWSALSLDLNRELRDRNFRTFVANVLLNFGLGIGAAALGIWIQG